MKQSEEYFLGEEGVILFDEIQHGKLNIINAPCGSALLSSLLLVGLTFEPTYFLCAATHPIGNMGRPKVPPIPPNQSRYNECLRILNLFRR